MNSPDNEPEFYVIIKCAVASLHIHYKQVKTMLTHTHTHTHTPLMADLLSLDKGHSGKHAYYFSFVRFAAGGLQKSDSNRKHTTAASSTHIISLTTHKHTQSGDAIIGLIHNTFAHKERGLYSKLFRQMKKGKTRMH